MRALVQKINAHPFSSKAFKWGKLVTITGGAQVIVQLTGLISGILIIRLLPTQEYALYTLANTMLGTLTVLADGGISAGVMAQGGKVWQDREKLGVVLVTGMELRKKFAVVSLLVATPALFYLLLHHGASWLTSILIILSLIPAFYSALSDTLLEVAPKLKQDIIPLQKNQLAANIGRLGLIGLTVFVFPWAFFALICGGLPRIWANFQLKKLSNAYANYSQKPDTKIRKEILQTVKRVLPGAVYYCLSGQINIWLISIAGSTQSVAQVGVLARLSIILTLFSTLIQIILIPRFARLPNKKKLILKWFINLQLILFGFAIAIIFISKYLETNILWIIGNKYAGIEDIFVLAISSAVISCISNTLYNILVSRNWVMNPFISIFIGLISQVVLIYVIDLSTLKGVYLLSVFSTIVGILSSYIHVFFLFKRRGTL